MTLPVRQPSVMRTAEGLAVAGLMVLLPMGVVLLPMFATFSFVIVLVGVAYSFPAFFLLYLPGHLYLRVTGRHGRWPHVWLGMAVAVVFWYALAYGLSVPTLTGGLVATAIGFALIGMFGGWIFHLVAYRR